MSFLFYYYCNNELLLHSLNPYLYIALARQFFWAINPKIQSPIFGNFSELLAFYRCQISDWLIEEAQQCNG